MQKFLQYDSTKKQDEGTGLSPALMNRYKKAAMQSSYVHNQRYGRIATTSGLGKKYKDDKLKKLKQTMDKRDKGLNMAAKKTGGYHYQKEDVQDPNHHKSEFERHAKKQLGHNSMANSEEAANNDKVMTHHEDKEEHHFAKAQHHANEYHKLTKKKLTMPPRAHEHEDHGYSNVNHGKSHGMSDDSHYVKEALAIAPLLPYIATAAATASRISPQTYAQAPSMVAKKAKDVGKAAKTTYKKFKDTWNNRKVSGVKANEEVMTTADAGIPQDTKNMGKTRLPMHILRRKLGVPINVTDRRRRKDKPPAIRKKFRAQT